MLLLSKDGDDKGDKEDNEETEQEDWGQLIMMLKRVGNFSMQEIKEMPYPFFKSILTKLYDKDTYSITRPYMGSSEDEEPQEEDVLTDKDDMAKILGSMNAQWGH